MTAIYHPMLDVTTEVPSKQVPIWQRSGWEVVMPLAEPFASVPAVESIPDEGTPDPSPEEE